ncbi:hypothetical protein [Pseudoalteromonas 'SMAR']|uniref:hypothetical protein n=1 Tax=Pseudoalteromonas 'SMAR' TaxID=3416908 RepID=UPI003AF264AD
MEKKSVVIVESPFLTILANSMTLYELSLEEKESIVKSSLVSASILSSWTVLEASANSFIKSIELSPMIESKLDKFPTLEKFNLILEYHQDKKIAKQCTQYQEVDNLRKFRNNLVHPREVIKETVVKTEYCDFYDTFLHEEQPTFSKTNNNKPYISYPLESSDALKALKSVINFLNYFIVDSWGLKNDSVEALLLTRWNGSICAGDTQIPVDELKVILRNNKIFDLDIKFLDLMRYSNQLPNKAR